MNYICDAEWTCQSAVTQIFSCNHCNHTCKKPSPRRKMEHLLKIGTAIASCTFIKANQDVPLDEDTHGFITEEYNELNRNLERARDKRRSREQAIMALPVPKRVRKQSILSFDTQEKDALDMAYARCLIQTGTTVNTTHRVLIYVI